MQKTALNPVRRTASVIADELRQAILDGEYPPHSAFPSYLNLCEAYGVGLRTVRRVMDALKVEGLIYSQKRRGTFVSDLSSLREGESRAEGAGLRCVTVVQDLASSLPLHHFVTTDYLAGYTDVLDRTTVQLRFAQSGRTDGRFDLLLAPGVPACEQGFLLVNHAPARLLDWLNRHGIPCVIQYHNHYPDEDLPPHHSVYVNKFGVAFRVVEYLASLGHRRIGFVGALPHDQWAGSVYDGYRAALQAQGLVHRPKHVHEVHTDSVSAATAPVWEFLTQGDLPTAVFAETDAEALALLGAAQTLGLSVPRDLSIVGINDLPEAAEADPPLTTVALPRRLLGRTGMETLLDVATGKFAEPVKRVLEGRLVVRKSAGTAPAKNPGMRA